MNILHTFQIFTAAKILFCQEETLTQHRMIVTQWHVLCGKFTFLNLFLFVVDFSGVDQTIFAFD